MEYSHFIIPFTIGVAALFAIVAWKWMRWLFRLPRRDKILIWRGIPTAKTLSAVGEVVSESLLHRKIFKTNVRLGYMHMSLAFGWFLLIAVGWIETTWHTGNVMAPLHEHIFAKYFFPEHMLVSDPVGRTLSAMMDLLLLFVLSGVALAWYKRVRSRSMGLKRTTKHTVGDKVALSALWVIFPARLIAESVTSGIHHGGSFLTGSIGYLLSEGLGTQVLWIAEPIAWWTYSLALGTFFVAMPFSRYMHIFTEIPLIFLRRWGVRSGEAPTTFDKFQLSACSRCGICIDPCQLQAEAGVNDIQSVYFLRDRRYKKLDERIAQQCLMCGRCEQACPVGIDLNAMRLNSRQAMANSPANNRYDYIRAEDRSVGQGKVGYFAGCMGLLTPTVLEAMEKIFAAAGEQVWWADRNGGVCCGRPLKLSGEVDAARQMMKYNEKLFRSHGITTLVTSCPICLKVFREDYRLEGIEVLHHSQYIERLIACGRIAPVRGEETFTYHDPCELGRGCGIYEQPRSVIAAAGVLVEPSQTGAKSLCCGASLADTVSPDGLQQKMAGGLISTLEATGAGSIVTGCPLCKKTIARSASVPVRDIAEVVAGGLSL